MRAALEKNLLHHAFLAAMAAFFFFTQSLLALECIAKNVETFTLLPF